MTGRSPERSGIGPGLRRNGMYDCYARIFPIAS